METSIVCTNQLIISMLNVQLKYISLCEMVQILSYLFYICIDRKEFLLSWKNIPGNFEFQSTVTVNVAMTTDQVEAALNANNIFTIARRSVVVGGGVNQDLMYMSAKFINQIWLLTEFKITTGSPAISVCLCVCTSVHLYLFNVCASVHLYLFNVCVSVRTPITI